MNEIERLWQTELEIMDVVHSFCKEHNLKYSLAYGTLLGAIRHKGFIPWDDDMDICMPRKDYDKLIELWEKNPPKGFVLQNKNNSPEFSQNFTKIRKENTTFLYFEKETQFRYHKGIFIDIFPGDNAPNNFIARKIQYCLSAVMLLFYREFSSGSKGMIGVLERILLSLPKSWHLVLRNWAENGVKRWNGRKTKQMIFPSTITELTRYFDADIFEHLQEYTFADRTYYGFADYDIFLKRNYGNYMELPPKEDQVLKHHPYLVDFEHNYEEL